MKLHTFRLLLFLGSITLFATLILVYVVSGPRRRPPTKVSNSAQANRADELGAPRKLSKGMVAPEFVIKNLETQQSVHFFELLGQKPIVLIFGSVT